MRIYLFIFLALTVLSCAPSRFVEPLSKNQQAVSFNIGGSLIDYGGATILVPLTSLTYAYGLSNKLTAFGSLHTTSLIFNNLQTEVGVLSHIRGQENYFPGLSSALALNYISELSLGNSKLWPQIDGNAYWNLNNNKHRFHLGYSIWIDTDMIDENKIGIVNPHLGYTYKFKLWELGTELKFLAPSYDNTKVFLPYQSLTGDQGATGLYFNISKRF